MPRRSRRYSSDSLTDSPSSEPSSDDERYERRRPLRKSRPRAARRGKRERSYRSMGKQWEQWPPRYDDSGPYDSPGYSSDEPPPRRAPPRSASFPPEQRQTKSALVLFGGVAVAILLVLLGAFALYRYFGESSGVGEASSTSGGSSAGKVVTVTKTLSGGVITTTVSTESSQATGGASSSGTTTAGDGSPTGSENSTSSSTGSLATTQPGLARNNIGIGFLPDYKNQDMAKINAGLGIKSSYYGWYAQLPATGEWDGSQLLSQLDDIKASGAIFQPAVMPTKGWAGLTKDEDYQALAIAKVMKQFTDEGIEVWLRFAHEVNWYLTDGTYQGMVDDFKAAWSVVAAAVADNPLVRMFFTPNVAGNFSTYEDFFPDDPSTVHYLSIDYYPKTPNDRFLAQVQEMYDKWCADGSIKFAIGETGNGWKATMEERLAWLEELTSEDAAKAMPHYVGVSWFNYNKGQVFYLYDEDTPATNEAMKAWIAAKETTTEGAAMGNA
ncbi:glycoside hydrolase superfamily [Rhodotorula diobovata]|uniref:Glycoside hydrolase superfamily n=1 Tax=Rhodotorula diobovata TaxID=5288 RepID=A0A5C5G2M6_9BASI|nr:glycoside hydrolase superfamily [Rhodotorula diobovata]